MFHAISWLVVSALFAFWSLGAWAFHSVATWVMANAGSLAGGSATGSLRLPDWLAAWVPAELAQALTSLVSGLMPAFESLIAWAPALASGLSVVVWVVWALGSALLLVLGLVLSGTIAVLRRRAAGAGRPSLAA